MLKQIAWTVLLIGLSAPLVAQSNQRLDELLSQAPARVDSVAYLLMASAGLVDEAVDPSAAFDAAMSAGLLEKTLRPEDPVSVELLAFLVMKTQKYPGGIGWMLFPNPRSAYRELSFQDLINSSAGPLRQVAGDEVIRTLNEVIASKGGEE